VLITLNASSFPTTVVQRGEAVAIVAHDAEQTLLDFCIAANRDTPHLSEPNLEVAEVWFWEITDSTCPIRLRAFESDREQNRHRRKYAEGQLSPGKCFYFRGPNGLLNLRAQNLITFRQLAEGIDDETWTYHLKRNDYSNWFRICINDEDLAQEAEFTIDNAAMSVAEFKALILATIQRNYILFIDIAIVGAWRDVIISW